MSKNYVYSTLTNTQKYTTWKPGPPGGLPIAVREITIEGGANVATKNLATPKGIMTAVSDEDLEHLESNQVFKTHEKNGFVLVEKRKLDVEAVVNKSMEKKDQSAPATPEQFAHLAGKELAAVPQAVNKK